MAQSPLNLLTTKIINMKKQKIKTSSPIEKTTEQPTIKIKFIKEKKAKQVQKKQEVNKNNTNLKNDNSKKDLKKFIKTIQVLKGKLELVKKHNSSIIKLSLALQKKLKDIKVL